MLGQSTNSHGGMESASNLVILLQARAATQNLRKPELTDGTLHVANLALSGSGSLDPLRWFAANTANHVGMGKRLGSSLLGFDVQSRGNRLCDTRVQRRSTAGNKHIVASLVARAGPAITIASPGAGKGGMSIQ